MAGFPTRAARNDTGFFVSIKTASRVRQHPAGTASVEYTGECAVSRGRSIAIAVAAAACLMLVAVALWLTRTPDDGHVELTTAERAPSAQIIEQGRVLAHLANCRACHTARGGEPFAGGRPIPTPFGTFYSPNITPDAGTGIGRWSGRDFWRALHLGYSQDGTLLYPAFPYPSYTKLTQQDARAIFEYLKTTKPVSRPSQQHDLRFPYNQRA